MRFDVEQKLSEAAVEEMNRRAHAAVAGLRAEASRLAAAGELLRVRSAEDVPQHPLVDMLPSPFDPEPTEEQLSRNLRDHAELQGDYDWATFIHAYSLGRWDPLKTPVAPRTQLQAPSLGSSRTSSRAADHLDVCDSPDASVPPDLWGPLNSELHSAKETLKPRSVTPLTNSAPPLYQVPNNMPTVPPTPSALSTLPESSLATRRATMPLSLGFSHRLRSSFADLRTSNLGVTSESMRPPNVTNADVTTSAATIRLAAARVSIAPLALPSPEHELTDPMRGFTTAIPGSHPPGLQSSHSEPPLKSPGVTRKSRLSSFWQGTQDIEESRPSTSQASPREQIEDHPSQDGSTDSKPPSFPFSPPSVVPATAPVRFNDEREDEDYFGSPGDLKTMDSFSSGSDRLTNSSTTTISRAERDVPRQTSAPPFDLEPTTVPALPRRICLTRQTSAPLPTLTKYEKRLRSARPASESAVLSQAGRSAKEEQMFSELGYLAPPNPPQELERRRALYK